eukprot:scaffold2153_cov131-Cylindrotheca_fusiformis.AAC.11
MMNEPPSTLSKSVRFCEVVYFDDDDCGRLGKLERISSETTIVSPVKPDVTRRWGADCFSGDKDRRPRPRGAGDHSPVLPIRKVSREKCQPMEKRHEGCNSGSRGSGMDEQVGASHRQSASTIDLEELANFSSRGEVENILRQIDIPNKPFRRESFRMAWSNAIGAPPLVSRQGEISTS